MPHTPGHPPARRLDPLEELRRLGSPTLPEVSEAERLKREAVAGKGRRGTAESSERREKEAVVGKGRRRTAESSERRERRERLEALAPPKPSVVLSPPPQPDPRQLIPDLATPFRTAGAGLRRALPAIRRSQEIQAAKRAEIMASALNAIPRLFPDLVSGAARETGPTDSFDINMQVFLDLTEDYQQGPESFLSAAYVAFREVQPDPHEPMIIGNIFLDFFAVQQRQEDVMALLRAVTGATEEQAEQFFAPRADALVSIVFPESTVEEITQLAENDLQAFVNLVGLQPRTWASQQLLRLAGLPWADIADVFETQKVVMEIGGEKRLVSVMDDGRVVDGRGQDMGTIDPVTEEFVPFQYRIGDVWKDIGATFGDRYVAAGSFLEWSANWSPQWMGLDGQARKWVEFGHKLQVQRPADVSGPFSWRDMSSARWWGQNVAGQVVTSAAMALVGVGVVGAAVAAAPAVGLGATGATVLGLIVGGSYKLLIDASLEAGSAHDEAQARWPDDPVKWDEIATEVFWNDIKLTGGLDLIETVVAFAPLLKARLKGSRAVQNGWIHTAQVGGRVAFVGLSEGGQEVLQNINNANAFGDPIEMDASMLETFIVGTVAGGVFGGTLVAYVEIKTDIISALPPEIKLQYDVENNRLKTEGVEESLAQEQALDSVMDQKVVQDITEAVVRQREIDELEKQTKPATSEDAVVQERTFNKMRRDGPQLPVVEPLTAEEQQRVAEIRDKVGIPQPTKVEAAPSPAVTPEVTPTEPVEVMTKEEFVRQNPQSKDREGFSTRTSDRTRDRVEGFDELPRDAEVIVFHATSDKNASALLEGRSIEPELQGRGILGKTNLLYVGTDPVSVQGMGPRIIAVTVKKSQIESSPEYLETSPSGTVGGALVQGAVTGGVVRGTPIRVQDVSAFATATAYESLVGVGAITPTQPIGIPQPGVRAAAAAAPAMTPEVTPTPPTQPPTPTTPAVEPTPQLPKAANIRLDKYPEEVRPLIAEWAETHPKEITEATRGVVSDAEVREGAERLTEEVGGDLDKFNREWKPGTAWTAEELVAIRSLLSAKTSAVLRTQKVSRENNSDQNVLALELALREQAAVQEVVHGLTAEAGRGLRSFRQDVLEATQSGDSAQMADLLSRARRGGKETVEELADKLSQLDVEDPTAVNKFIQESYKPHFFDYIIELFYNSILSGPKTHIVNSLSNTANTLLSPIERAVSATVDLPLATVQRRPRERFFNEVPADIFGAIQGIPEGFRQFAYVVKHGISLQQATKWEFRQRAFKGKVGAVISTPSRLLEAADALMKAINHRAALNAEIHRQASREKLKGRPFNTRVAELLASPSKRLLKRANDVAEERLFRSPPGKFGQTLMNLRGTVNVFGFEPLRYVLPFIRTPVNLVKFGLERTPLGFLNPRLFQNIAKNDPAAADQIARATIGSIGLASLVWYAAEGLITGAAPKDRAERERFYREGKQPFAIRVDGFWVSYQRLEPFNQLLAQVSIIVDMIRNEDDDLTATIEGAVNTFGQNFVSQTYMSSVSDLMNMLAEPERYAGRWLNRFGASLVIPMSAATRTAAQMLDRTVRDPKNFVETLEAGIPGLSTRVQAKMSALGESVERKSPPWFPISITPVEKTVLSQELERLKVNIGFAGRAISGIDLTPDERRDYQELAGRAVATDLERLMVVPEYWIGNEVDKEDKIKKVISTARRRALSEMRERLWTAGPSEERVKVLEEALAVSVAQLGKVIGSVPEFSHEPAEIYDVGQELDASFALILRDIPESSLKGLDVPALARAWYAKERAEDKQLSFPNTDIHRINADPDKGDTFEDFHNQWLGIEAAATPAARADLMKQWPQAHLGNLSLRQMELLRRFHAADEETQAQMLEDDERLKTNPRENWLRQNPKENARLAVWGQAQIYTQEAYNEFLRLVDELDIPDSALPKLTLPPKGSVKTHFAYLKEIGERSPGSWEAQLLLAKDDAYLKWLGLDPVDTPVAILELQISDRELYDQEQLFRDTLPSSPDVDADNYREGYQFAIAQLEAANPDWVENTWRIDAMKWGTGEEPTSSSIVEAHVAYQHLQLEKGATTPEVRLWRFDDKTGYDDLRSRRFDEGEEDGLTPLADIAKESGRRLEDQVDIWRIDVAFDDLDTLYDALPNDPAERAAFLSGDGLAGIEKRRRTLYRKQRRFREGLKEQGLRPDDAKLFVDFHEERLRGGQYWERWLWAHPGYYEDIYRGTMELDAITLLAEIPNIRHDELRARWAADVEFMEKGISARLRHMAPGSNKEDKRDELKAEFFADNLAFQNAWYMIKAYEELTPAAVEKAEEERGVKMSLDLLVAGFVDGRKTDFEGKPIGWDRPEWWGDDRVFQRHEDYYQYELSKGMKPIDFDLIPTRAFEKQLNEGYASFVKFDPDTGEFIADPKARNAYRDKNPGFDAEAVRVGVFTTLRPVHQPPGKLGLRVVTAGID